MNVLSAKCPSCGKVNSGLLLEDTKGLFECDNCKRVCKCIPLLMMDQITKDFNTHDIKYADKTGQAYPLIVRPVATSAC